MVKEEEKKVVERNQFFENRHPGIKIAVEMGISNDNGAKCKQTKKSKKCKQNNYTLSKEITVYI